MKIGKQNRVTYCINTSYNPLEKGKKNTRLSHTGSNMYAQRFSSDRVLQEMHTMLSSLIMPVRL